MKLGSGLPRERLFGSVAAWLNNELLFGKRVRTNCEWLSDKDNLYLVQIDEEDEDVRGVNPFQLRIRSTAQPPSSNGKYLKVADEESMENWDKLQVLKQLWGTSVLHKPTLFTLRLTDLPEANDNDGRKALEADFRRLIGKDGVVVRTSVRRGSKKLLNLPRTECLTPKEAVTWCISTGRELVREHELSQIAFVVHRFIAARASAWARAEPGNPTVEINALWGLPDGLQFCPYDIWEVHTPTSTATAFPNYKSDMLIHKHDGRWEYVRIKNELARHNCIRAADAKDIASRSSDIAERLNQACHIMWFVGCSSVHSDSFNIPWYWTEAHPTTTQNHDRDAYHLISVTDRATLQAFVDWRGPRVRQALALKPSIQLLRDNKFVTEVGIAAKEANVPVLLYGSTLAHAYYALLSAECSVVTPSEKQHSRIRRKARFGKLVRDNILERIAEKQEITISQHTYGADKKGFLIGKLLEEAMEVRAASDEKQKIEEFADLLEVLWSMVKTEDLAINSVKMAADRKRQHAGGFDKGTVLHSTGIPTANRSEESDVELTDTPTADHEETSGVDFRAEEVIMEQVSVDTVEVPFSFFGFTEINFPHTLVLEDVGVSLQLTLRSGSFEIKLIREPEQMDLPFYD